MVSCLSCNAWSLALWATLLGVSYQALEVKAKVWYHETFDDGSWQGKGVYASWRGPDEYGRFEATKGKWWVNESDLGMKTANDARWYAYSIKLEEPINNKDKDLVIQFLAKNEQGIDCGGAYIKLLHSNVEQETFTGEAAYGVMFGPDICGGNTKTHAILGYIPPQEKEERSTPKNVEHKRVVDCPKDRHAHFYALHLKKDNTYEMRVDGEIKASGNVLDGWELQPPQMIPDASRKKPSTWVDEEMMLDPTDKKPDDYDDIPATISDPDAEKPEDWDTESDGEWEAPQIPHPDFKGPWEQRMIKNPDYKGPWVAPQIPNPNFVNDKDAYAVCQDCAYIGFDLWQVLSGTIFDDILVTDSVDDALKHEAEILKKIDALKKAGEVWLEADQKQKLNKHSSESEVDADDEEGQIPAEALGEESSEFEGTKSFQQNSEKEETEEEEEEKEEADSDPFSKDEL